MNYYTKTHIAISKEQYQWLKDIGHYDFDTVKIRPIKPDLIQHAMLLNRVGQSYGWTKRPKYVMERENLQKRLMAENSRFYLAYHKDRLIGYCFISACSDAIGQKLGNVIEIENFGLFPEYTGQGLGPSFLAQVFDALMPDYDHIYLTTRSTNHKGVIPFYERMGMRILCREQMPDDLVESYTASRIRTA